MGKSYFLIIIAQKTMCTNEYAELHDSLAKQGEAMSSTFIYKTSHCHFSCLQLQLVEHLAISRVLCPWLHGFVYRQVWQFHILLWIVPDHIAIFHQNPFSRSTDITPSPTSSSQKHERLQENQGCHCHNESICEAGTSIHQLYTIAHNVSSCSGQDVMRTHAIWI